MDIGKSMQHNAMHSLKKKITWLGRIFNDIERYSQDSIKCKKVGHKIVC